VVIVAAEQFKQLERPKETFFEFFAPFKGSGVKFARRKDMPRSKR
jgi:hypothetical protein